MSSTKLRGCRCWVQITLAGSNFDTILAVYRGTSLTGLTKVASNNDCAAPASPQSCVTFFALPRTTYRVQVGSRVKPQPPSNGCAHQHLFVPITFARLLLLQVAGAGTARGAVAIRATATAATCRAPSALCSSNAQCCPSGTSATGTCTSGRCV